MVITSKKSQEMPGRDGATFFKINQMIPRGVIFVFIIILALTLCVRACKPRVRACIKRVTDRISCCRRCCMIQEIYYQNNILDGNNFRKLIFHLVVFVAFWSPWHIYTLSSYHYETNNGFF